MSSCYHFCKVLLTNFCHPKNFIFRKLYADMNIFRKFGSKKNSKGVIGESSESDLHPRRLAEVRPCEWPHTPFLQEAGILAEFMQYIANAGLTDCWKYALEAIINGYYYISLFMIIVYCSCYNVIRKS